MNRMQLFFMDLGDDTSVCSSLYLAKAVAANTEAKVYFLTLPESKKFAPHTGDVEMLYEFDRKAESISNNCDFKIDFTDDGKMFDMSYPMVRRVHNFHLESEKGEIESALINKMEYIESVTGLTKIVKKPDLKNIAPIMTYSPSMAAFLNLQGLPTIEMCYKFKTPGSFLPGSLVITGESFTLLQKEDLDLIFSVYQSGQVEKLFQNKSVLEVEWDLLYFHFDTGSSTIRCQKYPLTPMETFMDLFFKGFLLPVEERTFSIDMLLNESQKMDVIDFDYTLQFIKKTINLCIDDLESYEFPLSGSHWNFIRPYMDCSRRKMQERLLKSLHQALIGLDMVQRIQDRSRKVASMH